MTDLLWLAPPVYEVLTPILISGATAAATYIALKATGVKSRRASSLFYIVPLLAPLLIFATKPPTLYLGGDRIMIEAITATSPIIYVFETEKSLNYAALITYGCLAAAAGLLVALKLAGPRLVCFLLNVQEAPKRSYKSLHEAVERISRKAGVPTPIVGVVDALEPNAFTVGAGKEARVVVSTGLLRVLDADELEAVIAHEVAHVKNRDYNLSLLVSTLRTAFFVNPVAHLVASKILREREHLADTVSAEFTSHPEALGLALVKIWEANKSIKPTRVSVLTGILSISNLRSNALSLHPKLERRLEAILDPVESKTSSAKLIATGVVLVVVSFALMGSLTAMGVLPDARFFLGSLLPRHTMASMALRGSVMSLDLRLPYPEAPSIAISAAWPG